MTEDYEEHECYAIRLTYDSFDKMEGDRYLQCVNFIKGEGDRYFCVSEQGSDTGKFHLQCWLDIGDRKVATLRLHLRNFTRKSSSGKAGNGLFSCKKTDLKLPIRYLSYLMKEDMMPIHNLEQSEIDKVIAMNAEKKQKMEEKKKAKKSVRALIWDEFFEGKEFEEEGGSILLNRILVDEVYVARIVVKYYVDNDRCIRKFQLVSDTQYILCKLSGKYVEQLAQSVVSCIKANDF